MPHSSDHKSKECLNKKHIFVTDYSYMEPSINDVTVLMRAKDFVTTALILYMDNPLIFHQLLFF